MEPCSCSGFWFLQKPLVFLKRPYSRTTKRTERTPFNREACSLDPTWGCLCLNYRQILMRKLEQFYIEEPKSSTLWPDLPLRTSTHLDIPIGQHIRCPSTSLVTSSLSVLSRILFVNVFIISLFSYLWIGAASVAQWVRTRSCMRMSPRSILAPAGFLSCPWRRWPAGRPAFLYCHLTKTCFRVGLNY